MSVINKVFAIGFLLVSSFSLAEGPTLNEELNRLQQERAAEKEQLETEKQKIVEEITRLNERTTEIEQAMTVLENQVSLDFSIGELTDLLSKTFGQCQVQADSVPLVYYVKKNDVEIRLSFQDVLDNVIGKISKKTVGFNNIEIIEINIVPRYPDAHEASRTSALIRLNPESMEVVHATFTGLRVNDQMFGWSNSLSLYQMVCEL